MSEPQPVDPQPPSDLFADKARLDTLLGVAFDVAWEMSLEGSEEGRLWVLQDIGIHLGFQPGEFPRSLTASEWIQRMHPDDVGPLDRALHYVLHRHQLFREEYRVRRADGGYTWWEERGAPVEFQDGRAVRWIGAARNVTERKQAEEELRELKAQLERENVYLREKIAEAHPPTEMVGKSAALKGVLELVGQVAGTNAPVVITGETGTGKELVARAIHSQSPRCERPFVAVNCAALPTTLVESELFGYEKGAFSGAVSRRIGRFEHAHQGTIFLDEVGELPLDLQAKLLRVLQRGEFERLGSSETARVDVRVIAATNRDLEQEVEDGRFRRDLYYRLRVFPIHMPPLRERREDIPLLVTYLLEKKGAVLGKRVERIPREALDTLAAYDWPGNVRELENVIERALILSRGPVLAIGDVLGRASAPRRRTAAVAREGAAGPADQPLTLAQAERAHILRICEACGWRIKGRGGAAECLGLDPSTLHFRMRKLGIARPS